MSYAAQPRLSSSRCRPMSRRCGRAATAARPASLETLLPRLDAVRAVVRFRQPIPRRCAVGDALGAVSRRTRVGNSARDAYLRELDGIAVAAICGAHQAAARRLRIGARKAVRLFEGVPDARRAGASRQEASPVPGRRGVGGGNHSRAGTPWRPISSACSNTATRCARSRLIPRSSRKPAAESRKSIRRSCSVSCSEVTATNAGAAPRHHRRGHREGAQAQERTPAVGARSELSTPNRCSRRSREPGMIPSLVKQFCRRRVGVEGGWSLGCEAG